MVELKGGPRDGEIVEVAEGRLEIMFPARKTLTNYFDINPGPDSMIQSIAAPILRNSQGRYYVDVPKETYLA